jgi:2-keto-4-pentenoate hydratase/2-oxohepta-3-ene-1,7-dioic acid hydratase in catechol pathway
VRLVTIRTTNGTRAGRLDGDRVVPLNALDVAAVLEAGLDNVREAGDPIAVTDADLAPVIPRPSKVFCLGLNYRSHIEEMGAELPKYPTLFAKFASALIGARDPIALPDASNAVDWEGELAFVRYVSTVVTLEPGDVFSTGTPSGVAAGMQPARFLQAGQVVRTSIEGLGELVNECVKQ